MNLLAALASRWVWRMAARDARGARMRLAICGMNLALGIAALTAVEAARSGARGSIEREARALLGADLIVTSQQPFTAPQEQYLRELGGSQARDTSFATMLSGASSGRLVSLHAVTPGFPLYGQLETDPPAAGVAFRAGGGLLAEAGVLAQLHLSAGDTVKVGRAEMKVLGAVVKAPGDNVFLGALAPRVFVVDHDLAATGLLDGVNLSRRRVLLRFDGAAAGAESLAAKAGEIRRLGMQAETAGRGERELGGGIDRFGDFLSLLSLAAAALGGVGVAGAVRAHLVPRLPRVATLRCLGCPAAKAQAIFVAQALALAAVSAVVGVVAGGLGAAALARAASDHLPLPIAAPLTWNAAARGLFVGLAVTAGLAWPPLVRAGQAPPLAALRSVYEHQGVSRGRIWSVTAAGLALAWFAAPHQGGWRPWLGWSGGMAAALGALAVTGAALVHSTRRIAPRLPFAWRHGLANLHRPNNSTLLTVAALGLGALALLTVQNCRATLIAEFRAAIVAGQSDTLLFDIQSDQVAALSNRLETLGFPALEGSPMVTMRLLRLKGVSTEELRQREGPPGREARRPGGPRRPRGRWALDREYRATWRDHLTDAERLTEGTFVGRMPAPPTPDQPAPISLETNVARELGVIVGDRVDFDLQGIEIPCRVTSLRAVQWRQLRPNFFILFPAGAIDDAPASWLMGTHTGDPAAAGSLQGALAREFPNVSVIDLGSTLKAVDALLGKLSAAAGLLAGFTAVSGLLALTAASVAAQATRRREAAMLRAMGASARTLRTVVAAESLATGGCAAVAAAGLAVGATWAIARWVLETNAEFSLPATVGVLLGLPALTLAAGWLTGRSVVSETPLAALRGVD